MKTIFYIYLLLVLFSCEEKNVIESGKSIYDYNSNEITGGNSPVMINISEKDEVVYKVKCDSLISFKENILLYDNVDIEIFSENIKSTNLLSDKAEIKGSAENSGRKTHYNFSNADMIAEGNVTITSYERNDRLLTNKIMLYNNNRCNILIDTAESVTFIMDTDTMRGFGFESDCEMKNWKILKPAGVIYNK